MFVVSLIKIIIFFLRTFTSNSATALPGLILEKYFPRTLSKILSQFDQVILITGTNGKTTTSRLVGDLLRQNDIKFISNTSGSNLIRGIASVIINKADFFGRVSERIAVLEVEEATMPKLVKFLTPEIIVVTNIFRDQLDAYGEIDKTFQYIRDSIKNSSNPRLILNNDDDRVKSLAEFSPNKSLFVSFDEEYLKLIKLENRDNQNNNINETLKDINKSGSANLFQISNITIDNDLRTSFDITCNNVSILSKFNILVPGYHNTYNASVALLTFSSIIKKELHDIVQDNSFKLQLDQFKPVFGRGEIVKVNNTKFQILLGKNPAGLNLNLKLLQSVEDKKAVLLILNDKIADGTDVSWIWDCDFNLLQDANFKNIYIAGSRRFDMALRIKYQDMEVSKIFDTLDEAVNELSSQQLSKVFVLPTYTAMLQFRKALAKKTKVEKIYE